MRIRTGHGPDDWSYGPPANPGSIPIRGELVRGASGNVEKNRRHQEKYKDKVREAQP